MIVEWDIIAFNGIIHAIAEPLRIPPPIVHLGQVSARGHGLGKQAAEPAGARPGSRDGATESAQGPAPSSLLPRHGSFWPGCPRSAGRAVREIPSLCRNRAPVFPTQVNGAAPAAASVATGTLSALCFALALAAGAGVAYYCVKRRRREEQFGYFQVSAGGSGLSAAGAGGGSPGERGSAPPRCGPAGTGTAPPARSQPRPAPRPLQADLCGEEEEEAGPHAARHRPQRPLVAIPNPLYGGHAPDYEPLQVSPAPGPAPHPGLPPV